MMSSAFEEFDEPYRPSDNDGEITPLAFEKEFDGIRRQVAPTDEPSLHDPSRYWDLAGGGTD